MKIKTLTKNFLNSGGVRQGERNKCFNFVYKGITYQIAVSYNQLKGKDSLISGKQRLKASNTSDKNHKMYNNIHQITQSYVANP